jgi:hypothetical protein
MGRTRALAGLLGLFWLVATACTPSVGDACLSSLECPEGASCDTTVPGGYCLVFNCSETNCPDGSVCVDFRTFSACMLYCQSDDDCRTAEGYVCRTDLRPAPFCYQPALEP